MDAIADLVGMELKILIRGDIQSDLVAESYKSRAVGLVEWEEYLQQKVATDTSIVDTEKQALIMARRGQGKFRENVSHLERKCRITKVDRPEHLRASHIKPWRDSSNQERLDGENGLLLTPTIDHLFDRGFISFEDNGRLLISPVAHKPSLERMGIETQQAVNVGAFTNQQAQQLDFHRNFVFLESRNR
ncbi:MAG: HNH endonuclease [Gammaproteobacteria bacterium]|nr:HNH endonuclease [Gammaproteobacteria bacterium]